MLAGLYESQVSLGQHHRVVARDRAHDRNAARRERVDDQHTMAIAAHLVEHHATQVSRLTDFEAVAAA